MPQSSPAAAQTARVPQNSAQLQALRARREELDEQLQSITQWRGRLVQERHNAQAAGNRVVVEELDGRISELGARSKRIEQAMLSADDAIAQALANGVTEQGMFVAPAPPAPPAPGIPEIAVTPRMGHLHDQGLFTSRDIAIVALGQSLGFVILGFVLWRMAFRRGARSVQTGAPGHVNQLQQSVDAIAVEVERISENQRFVTRLLNEQGQRAAEQSQAGPTAR